MRITIIVGFALIYTLAGCATSSGVLPEGPDSFMVTREGGPRVTALKKDAYREANEFCESKGKEIVVTNTRDHSGGIGVYPLAEIHFMCLVKGDPELRRPHLAPVPNTVVQVQH